MTVTMLKSKIHRATVTQAELDYVGSITIDEALMKASGIMEYEKVQIADVNNGQRFETYVIAGEEGICKGCGVATLSISYYDIGYKAGVICLNGAAARCVQKGDKVIIMSYAQIDNTKALEHKPKVVFVDDDNRITRITSYEKHGLLKDMED